MIDERLASHMFPNEKKTSKAIDELEDGMLKADLMLYQITRYEYHSLIHGSGKEYLGKPMYEDFMNDKWELVYCDIKKAIQKNAH